jgi:hypothetical protein
MATVAVGGAGIAVRGRILAVVGFGFDDPAADAVDQHGHADQLARHQMGGCGEIDPGKNGRRHVTIL